MKFIYYFICQLLVFSAYAQEMPELIQNPQGRKCTTLNGKWSTIIDPYENGFYNYRYEEHQNGYFKNEISKDGTELIEYKFDDGSWLNVPGDWNTQRESLLWYEGTIWYKYSFNFAPAPNELTFLYFGAVNYEAIVYLNGEKLGKHIGGFTPFQFDVTGKLKSNNNFIVVKVDNKRHRDAIPTVNTDWWNYGGITRDVNLISVPKTYIKGYHIQLKKGSADIVEGWIQLSDSTTTNSVKLQFTQAGISKNLNSDKSGRASFSFKAKLKLWSPDSPFLYKVLLQTSTDSVSDEIGFRSIEVKGQDIVLNGSPVFLKGISIHEEVPTAARRAFSKDDAYLLLHWAKELGCNYVRLAHYPHNENMTRMADKLGLMVWSEIPVYWTIQWQNPDVLKNARNQLYSMISRDINRASIVLWSVANETPLQNDRTAFLQNLIELARNTDPGRLITAALEVHNTTGNTKLLDNPLGASLDVLGCNEYIGWYDDKRPEDCDGIIWKTTYNKPLIISELGADCLFGFHGDKKTRFTEEYQENFYIHQINMLTNISFLRGVSPWILTDFRSPRRPLTYIEDYWNRKGLLSDRGEKKKAYFVLQNFYKTK